MVDSTPKRVQLEDEPDGTDEQGGEGAGDEDGEVECDALRCGGTFSEAVEVSFTCGLAGGLGGGVSVDYKGKGGNSR